MRTNFNYKLLRALIESEYKTYKAFSNDLGITTSTLRNKLNNKSYFYLSEMLKATELLKIQPTDIQRTFFNCTTRA